MWKRPQLNECPHVEQAAAGHVRLNPAVVRQHRRHGVRRAVGLVHAPRRCRVRLDSRPLSDHGFRMPRAAAVARMYLVGKGWTLPIAQAHLADQELVRPDDQSPRQGAWGADGEGQLLSRGDGGLPGDVAPHVGGVFAQKRSMSQQGKHCQRSEAGEMSHRSGAVGTPRRRSCGGRPCAGPQDPPRLCRRNNGRLRTDLCT